METEDEMLSGLFNVFGQFHMDPWFEVNSRERDEQQCGEYSHTLLQPSIIFAIFLLPTWII